jgi:phosphoribosyl-AMP cyclohydrolase
MLLLALLAGCSTAPTLPVALPAIDLPAQLLLRRQTTQETRDLILVVQQDPAGLRFSMLDPIGMPVARQLLQQGRWSNDGLVPPNADAHAVFAALLFAWTPADSLAANYAPGTWTLQAASRRRVWQDGKREWTVVYENDGNERFTLTASDGTTWRVGPLPGARR